ncbi:MAG: hypothetical protein C0582_01185 [Alphaproteobacteria bacterium]|nr:MAG: hypothetical protein C0582_01185 [Alphaproteobacteria bacterium]
MAIIRDDFRELLLKPARGEKTLFSLALTLQKDHVECVLSLLTLANEFKQIPSKAPNPLMASTRLRWWMNQMNPDSNSSGSSPLIQWIKSAWGDKFDDLSKTIITFIHSQLKVWSQITDKTPEMNHTGLILLILSSVKHLYPQHIPELVLNAWAEKYVKIHDSPPSSQEQRPQRTFPVLLKDQKDLAFFDKLDYILDQQENDQLRGQSLDHIQTKVYWYLFKYHLKKIRERLHF